MCMIAFISKEQPPSKNALKNAGTFERTPFGEQKRKLFTQHTGKRHNRKKAQNHRGCLVFGGC
nr:MAG TPA: hypothetical protein [Caudoviricetes sp.]